MYTILCVDDDKRMLSMLRRTLRSEEYKVLTAQSGDEGLGILESELVHLVISDYQMPNMDGGEFLRMVHVKYPETRRILITGSKVTELSLNTMFPEVIHKYISKPFKVNEFRLEVKSALEQWELNGYQGFPRSRE